MRVLILAGLLILGFSGVSQAQQQRHCAPFEKYEEFLAQNHQEHEVSFGVAANGARLVLFTTKDGGTWTMVAVLGNGYACMVASGFGWEDRDRPFRAEPPSGTEGVNP